MLSSNVYRSFDGNTVLAGLKKCAEYTLEFKESRSISGNKNNEVIISPDTVDISFLSTFSDTISIVNGAQEDRLHSSSSCIKLNISSTGKVKNSSSLAINECPFISENAIVRAVVPHLIESFPSFVNDSLIMEEIDNSSYIVSSHTKTSYLQKKPNFIAIPDDLAKKLTDFSDEIYNKDFFLSNNIEIITTVNPEVYYSSDGVEIIQYSKSFSVNFVASFVNSNQVLQNIQIVERFNEEDLENVYSILVDKFNEIYNKKKVLNSLSSGQYYLLLEPDAADVFFHEAFAAHLLSGTYIAHQISTIFNKRLGERFDKLKGIDLIMDPTLEGAYGSYNYDHEGVRAKKVILLEDGKMNSYLTDRSSAALLEARYKDEQLIQTLSEISNIKDYLKLYVDASNLIRQFSSIKKQLKYLLENYHLNNLIKFLLKNGFEEIVNLDWRSNCSVLKDSSNGHSRVQWWMNNKNEIIHSEARMSNLVIVNNNENDYSTIEDFSSDFCKKNEVVFYLSVNASAGQIDVQNGSFIIDASSITKVYTDGRPSENIDPGTFSMSLENFLDHIIKIGHDSSSHDGMCGANSGYVPVSAITPQVFCGPVPYQSAPESSAVPEEIIKVLDFKSKL